MTHDPTEHLTADELRTLANGLVYWGNEYGGPEPFWRIEVPALMSKLDRMADALDTEEHK